MKNTRHPHNKSKDLTRLTPLLAAARPSHPITTHTKRSHPNRVDHLRVDAKLTPCGDKADGKYQEFVLFIVQCSTVCMLMMAGGVFIGYYLHNKIHGYITTLVTVTYILLLAIRMECLQNWEGDTQPPSVCQSWHGALINDDLTATPTVQLRGNAGRLVFEAALIHKALITTNAYVIANFRANTAEGVSNPVAGVANTAEDVVNTVEGLANEAETALVVINALWIKAASNTSLPALPLSCTPVHMNNQPSGSQEQNIGHRDERSDDITMNLAVEIISDEDATRHHQHAHGAALNEEKDKLLVCITRILSLSLKLAEIFAQDARKNVIIPLYNYKGKVCVQLTPQTPTCWEYIGYVIVVVVVLAANDLPSINDATYSELVEIIAKIIAVVPVLTDNCLHALRAYCLYFFCSLTLVLLFMGRDVE
ncbi:pantothenate kinase-related family protein [Striga asiatica]|uniref:Pantothenate kinase-related family protein n=1 Tax=Striga asiatica TaxID=4170 RepID=A0A5A7Q6N5_STRAF|nr:pantothenate kinase-related family protein [Striga asiatica]